MGPLNPTVRRLLALFGMSRTFVRGEGAWLVDATGRRFLDCGAQYGALALGHNAPCVQQAVRAALDAAEPAMVQPYRGLHADALARRLVELAPGHLTHCVFTNSGAETVEAAIKLVRARSGRELILSAHGSFHGKTTGALAVTGQPQYAAGVGPLAPGFGRVPFGDADALEACLAHDGARVAALFLEPIQGERGVIVPPPDYLARARELCTRHGIALVLDEIQTGLGRTGALFACEHEGVAPDLLLIAKALGGGLFPLGACLVADEFWDSGFALRHSSTFANNNVACRVGLAVLEALTTGGLCREAARKGEALLARLVELAARYPEVIAATRGRGLLTAIELHPPGDEAGAFLSFVRHQGLYAYAVAATVAERASVLVLPALGDASVIRVMPPLMIGDDDLERALDGLDAVCARLAENATDVIVRSIGALDAEGVAAEAEPAVVLPPPILPARGTAPSYAFLVHYTDTEHLDAIDPELRGLDPAERARFFRFAAQLPAGVLRRTPTVRSLTGASVDGVILALGMLPDEMARLGARRVGREIERAVDLAASLGVGLVGLGGYTVPYSRRGLGVTGRGPAITTGNALTAGMAFAATLRLAKDRDLALREARVAIVGARGSVGTLCARLFARERPRSLVLVGNPESGGVHLERLRQALARDTGAVSVSSDLAALAGCDIVVSATAAARPVLDEAPLASGTIVCDIARPYDASPRVRARTDLTVIDGGLVALPEPGLSFGTGNLMGLPASVQVACLAETILLALEGEWRDVGVGRDVELAEVDHMLALADRHGFRLAEPIRAAAR